jgi:hypothetical protein
VSQGIGDSTVARFNAGTVPGSMKFSRSAGAALKMTLKPAFPVVKLQLQIDRTGLV